VKRRERTTSVAQSRVNGRVIAKQISRVEPVTRAILFLSSMNPLLQEIEIH
jgi:hypothetical protein